MNALKKKLNNAGGFTLVEMLIVVAIIAVLIAVSIPMVNSALEKANDATDQANLRAAKALATIALLDESVLPTGKSLPDDQEDTKSTVVYYNATEGKLVADNKLANVGTGYGKCTNSAHTDAPFISEGTEGGTDKGGHAGKVIKVTFKYNDDSGAIDITYSWADPDNN